MAEAKRLRQWSVWKKLFEQAFQLLVRKNPLLLAGATAFFTVFSAAPIILIIIQVIGLLVGKAEVRSQVAKSLAEIMGSRTQGQILHTLTALNKEANEPVVTIIGFVVLLFIATNIFNVMKTSLNVLWMVKPARKLSFAYKLTVRLRFVLLIVAAGFLLVIGLASEAMQEFLGDRVSALLPFLSFYFRGALHYLLSLIIHAAWFALVFRYLADVRPAWSAVFAGGLLTAILFLLGRLLLHALLLNSHITTLYGASASVVLLLLFVFYSSLILYYGAAFTVVWSQRFRCPVKALPHATFYTIAEQKSSGAV